ncbi:MAG TPA: ParB/RepB/Spo0J family partition protein, partial [Bacteroidales bacterium]|nr:ParB/RepB/Spo0J family partition protein [Bacteroidales bacterium]
MQGKKKALGRGLSAILESPETDITSRDISGEYVVGAIAHIAVEKIEPNPFQPRMQFNEEELAELTLSIQAQGIIQPITVRKLGYDKYQLISGDRRLKAARLAGLTEIPAYIRVANDEQMLELALVENIQREELNPLEIAISFQRLLDECKLKQEELSQKIGKDRSTIANYIRLLKLPTEIQIAIRDKKISMGHARALITIDDVKTQLVILH